MLRRFHDLVGQAVKTDKGFKDVHVRQVASMVSQFAGGECEHPADLQPPTQMEAKVG
jgi:hypothetical protein